MVLLHIFSNHHYCGVSFSASIRQPRIAIAIHHRHKSPPKMLILVAGLTGNLGTRVGEAVLAAGHQLRGLGRSPHNLPPSLSSKAESFIQTTGYDDIAALDRACNGADAVICCYAPDPVLILDGQLLLLRAAERAGIKRFHAVSWNLDWEEWKLGQLETYDSYLSFYYHARLTSDIKPLYTAVGVLAMTFFAVPRAGALEKDKSFWVRGEGLNRTINVIGDGTEDLDWCTEEDAAAWSIALLASDRAENGGYYHFNSQKLSLALLKETYQKVHPEAKVEWNKIPIPTQQFKEMYEKSRKAALESGTLKEKYRDYIGFVYIYHMLKGIGGLEKIDADIFPGVKRTSLEEYIRSSGIP